MQAGTSTPSVPGGQDAPVIAPNPPAVCPSQPKPQSSPVASDPPPTMPSGLSAGAGISRANIDGPGANAGGPGANKGVSSGGDVGVSAGDAGCIIG